MWTSVDLIRALNAALPDQDDDRWISEDTDSPPAFQLDPFIANLDRSNAA